jgi:hypothetical protein
MNRLQTAGLLMLAATPDLWLPAARAQQEPPTPQQVTLVCEAVYLPAREIWVRRVRIGFDQARVTSVAIDGVPVYSFTIDGTRIATALDNERIQIDTAAQTWQSDFRGLAQSQGRCERAR